MHVHVSHLQSTVLHEHVTTVTIAVICTRATYADKSNEFHSHVIATSSSGVYHESRPISAQIVLQNICSYGVPRYSASGRVIAKKIAVVV